MNIYVSHLSWGTSSEGLGNLFAQFGEVASANVITDRETGRSRGFGFVEMPDDDQARKAMEQLNGASFEGQTITVTRPVPARSVLRAVSAAAAAAVTAAAAAAGDSKRVRQRTIFGEFSPRPIRTRRCIPPRFFIRHAHSDIGSTAENCGPELRCF